ncbi:hypothetical protein [Nostoc sp.]
MLCDRSNWRCGGVGGLDWQLRCRTTTASPRLHKRCLRRAQPSLTPYSPLFAIAKIPHDCQRRIYPVKGF